jgi:DNA gyrase subunit B
MGAQELAKEEEGDEATDKDEDANEDEGKEEKKKGGKKPNIQRYKGLGEMNAEELWETTMDPTTRTLKIVSIHEAAEADKVFEMLMGNEVGPRKSFIQTYAKEANLDI